MGNISNLRDQWGGSCCPTASARSYLVGGWKHSSRASLASSKRLSMRISKKSKRHKRRGTKRRGTKRRGTKRRGTKRRGTKHKRHKRRR